MVGRCYVAMWSLLILISACSKANDSSKATPSKDSQQAVGAALGTEAAPPRIAVDQIVTAFRENEFAAAAKYGETGPCNGAFPDSPCGHVIVTGEIADLGREESRIAYVDFKTAERNAAGVVTVRAVFDKNHEAGLTDLRRGQSIEARCDAVYDRGHYGQSGVRLINCSLPERDTSTRKPS